MRKKIIFLLTLFAVIICCKENPNTYPAGSVEYDIASKFMSYTKDYRLDTIVFEESFDTKIVKDSLALFLSKIDNGIKTIGDSEVVNVLIPNISYVREKITRIIQLEEIKLDEEDSYKLYRIKTTYRTDKSCKKEFFAIIRNTDIIISLNEPENDFAVQYKEVKSEINNVMYSVETLSQKDHSTLTKLKNEELKKQELARIAAEKAEKKRLAEIERNRIPDWDEVASIIKRKTGGKVIGIWNNGPYIATVLYNRGGRVCMRHCQKSKEPLSPNGYEMRLRKISRNTYQYNEEGSDMPERFVINEYGDLDTYCYNPDGPYGGEWVGMGSHTRVY